MMLTLCKVLIWLCTKLGRVEYIYEQRGKAKAEIYLVRYYVFRNRFFKFYVHRFLKDDLDDLHDHPWDFATYMVQGSYTETFYYGPAKSSLDPEFRPMTQTRNTKNLRFLHRYGHHFHKVTLDKQYTINDLESAPLTLFFAGPKYREWSFLTKSGLVHWKEYLSEEQLSNDKLHSSTLS